MNMGRFGESALAILVVATLCSLFCPTVSFRASSPLSVGRKVLQKTALSVEKTDASEKLIFDTKNNRLFEADVETPVQEEFALVDSETGQRILLTKEEKERIFLDSIQSYYFKGNSSLSDEEFSQLRDDLSWEGSSVVTMNRDETRFVNAVMAWNKGQPIMSDEEFDKLKQTLSESNSPIAVSTEPKCYVDTGVCKVTWQPDNIRTTSLYVPAAAFFTTLYLGILYEIPFIRFMFNPILLLLIGIVPISKIAKEVTEGFLFKDPFVAVGPCPSCGVENKAFFGDVLGVEGLDEEVPLKCTNCKVPLTVKRATLRVSTLPPSSTGPPPKKPKSKGTIAA